MRNLSRHLPFGALALAIAALVVLAAATVAHAADAPLAVTSVETSVAALSPNGDGRSDSADVTFALTAAAQATVTVRRDDGTIVRTLWNATVVAGDTTIAWDGTDDAGARVPDGSYRVFVGAAALPGATPATGSTTLRVDTTPPARVAATSLVRQRGANLLRVPLALDEPALVTVSVRDGRTTRSLAFLQAAGRSYVELRAPAQWRRTRGHARYAVTLQASDDAWNGEAVSLPVDVSPAPPTAAPIPSGAPGAFLMPVAGPITSPFGPRGGEFTGGFHAGIDIGVPTGTPIHASARGTVVVAGWVSGYGNCTIVDHGGGMRTLYGHQSKLLVHVGQAVARGQVIGLVGSTGHSTGPHLHFEIQVDGTPRNPLQYL